MKKAYVTRLAGAVLLVCPLTKDENEAPSAPIFYLIGDTKEPINFAECGFVDPGIRDVQRVPYLSLTVEGPIPTRVTTPAWVIGGDGPYLAQLLAQRLLIRRNGSVSERLWTLISDSSAEDPETGATDVQWLTTIPGEIWEAVRDSVLRC